jgi:hypothetical protein
MTTYGYSFVSDSGLTAFPQDLDNSAWRDVPTLSFGDGDPQGVSLLSAPFSSVLKWAVLSAIDSLAQAIARAPSSSTVADEGFDRQQRILDASLNLALLSDDPEEVAAAQRLKAALTLGSGTAQTTLSYQGEVDFGRDQARLAAQPAIAADLTTLQLTERLTLIQAATERLALTLGRIDQDPALTPSRRLILTRAACTITLNTAHSILNHVKANAPTATTRDLAADLLAPFEALLSRHRAPKPSPAS